MREVVKKVVKYQDAGIIYLSFDSQWVSPTQIIPKKSGLPKVPLSFEECRLVIEMHPLPFSGV